MFLFLMATDVPLLQKKDNSTQTEIFFDAGQQVQQIQEIIDKSTILRRENQALLELLQSYVNRNLALFNQLGDLQENGKNLKRENDKLQKEVCDLQRGL